MEKIIVDGKVMYKPTAEERSSVRDALKGVQKALAGLRPMSDEEMEEWKKTATPEQLKAKAAFSEGLKKLRPPT